nr:Glu/Leu/Phe/Val dehydrogenase family protein [Nocardioides humi]
MGDPARHKTPELLRAYARFVDGLDGRYVTAADVGTCAEDLDVIGEVTPHVVGRTSGAGGSGDSGRSTAAGVFYAMRAAATEVWGSEGLRGRAVGIEGVGKVGAHLAQLLLCEGASVVVADPDPQAIQRVRETCGDEVPSVPRVIDADVDIYAPCALGASLTRSSVTALRARIVCGAANNQLATADIDLRLHHLGVTWVPDYVANAGGLIQVGGELRGHTGSQVHQRVRGVGDTTREILLQCAARRISTGMAAAEIVHSRLREAPAERLP